MPDRYTIAARIAPAYITLSPLFALAISLGIATTPAALGGVPVLCALGVLAAEVVRSAGQRIEPALWREWGGGPAQGLLRWRGGSDIEVARRHDAATALTGVELPSRAEEAQDQAAADDQYDAAIRLLRPLTHDPRYPLVAAENIGYGFRRNLLACKPIAALIGLIVVVATIAVALARSGPFFRRADPLTAPFAWSVVLLLVLMLVVRNGWVRSAADRYASQLMTAAVLAARDRQSGAAASGTPPPG